jgi:hypothetical protein
MLNLLKSVPGHRIAAGYNFKGDIDRYNEMLPGDVVHGHDYYTNDLWKILHAQNIQVIILMRDPRDQIISHMFHIKRDSLNPWHQRIMALDHDEALMMCIEGRPGLISTTSMIKLTKSWLNERNKAICVRYEDLLLNPVQELSRVFEYLGIKVNKDLVRTIIERNRFERLSVGRRIWRIARKPGQEDTGSHFRKGIIGDWRNHFNEAHIQCFKELAGKTLIEWGYEKDLDW